MTTAWRTEMLRRLRAMARGRAEREANDLVDITDC